MNKVFRVFRPSDSPWRDWALLWAVMGIAMFVTVVLRVTLVDSLLAASGISATNVELLGTLKTIVLNPIAEEVIFRGWLVNAPGILALGAGICTTVLVSFTLLGSSILIGSMTYWVFPLLVLGAVASLFTSQRAVRPTGLLLSAGALTTVLFAVVHITNYKNLQVPNWLVFFVVLPQLIAGLFLLIGRVRVGLLGSMGLHMTLNAEVLLLGSLPNWGLVFLMVAVSLVGKLILAYRWRKWFLV